MFKKFLRNERGLTLIELLAVVVILGIIAAIAVPSIGGIIDNTKRDAHIANAQQIASSAKLYMAATNLTVQRNGTSAAIQLNTLVTNGYLNPIKDPNGNTEAPNYSLTNSTVTIHNSSTGVYEYRVVLVGGATSGATTYINAAKDAGALIRADVSLPTAPAPASNQ